MQDDMRIGSPLERALLLKTVPALRDLDGSEIADLALRAREKYVRKGEKLFQLGQPLSSFHIVVSGRFKVRGGEHGDSRVGPGETLGLLSLLARRRQGLDAVAEFDCLTLEVEEDAFLEVLEDNFVMLQHEIQNVAHLLLAERQRMPSGTYLGRGDANLTCPDRELDLIERLLFYRLSLNYPRANMEALMRIARLSAEHRYRPGDALWQRGEASGFFYILVAGTVRCHLEDVDRYFQAGPGYPLGNLESMCGAVRWYRPVAESPVVALRAETDQFFDLLEDHFAMAVEVLAGLAAGLIETQQEHREAGATGA